MIYPHGGDIYSREVEHDFSANINPLGMPDSVKRAVISSLDSCEHYPDSRCTALTSAIAQHETIAPEHIVCGNGAADLIYRIVHAFKPKRALLPAPTFCEYEKALNECECKTEHFYLNEADGFKLDEKILNLLNDEIDMLFLCNPNNPVGNLINPELLGRISELCFKKGIMLVCDECFLDFAENGDLYTIRKHMNENIIILKAFTKIYAIAGLRLGYAIFGDMQRADAVRESGQSWSVSIAAQAAGVAALAENCYAHKAALLIAAERNYLIKSLKAFELDVYSSSVNFILFRCDAPLERLLLQRRIAIRDCGNYLGLDDSYYRIAVRLHEENELLINAIGEELAKWREQ